MEGVEIVIKPIHLERVIYSVVIIVLAVLLIIHWKGGSCNVNKEAEANMNTLTEAGINQTNQTTNLTATTQTSNLCANGVKDQDETDVDCGGNECDGCAEFKMCNVDSDCSTGMYCSQHIKCLKPTCTDGIKNQNEVQVDCGGLCGGYWYDGVCNDEPKPQYSGRIDLSILTVGTSVNPSSGLARIDNVKFSVANGKQDTFISTAYIYARKPSGTPYYESSISGDEIPIQTIELPSLSLGQNITRTANISKTLTETEPSDDYRIVVQLRDSDDALIKEATWIND
jgi:hypothetical protein